MKRGLMLLVILSVVALAGGVCGATEPNETAGLVSLQDGSMPLCEDLVKAVDPESSFNINTAGPACPADPNPCEVGCHPVNCTSTRLGTSGCQLSDGSGFSCPQVGQQIVYYHCPCVNNAGMGCLPHPPYDDPTPGTDILSCQ